MPKIYYRCSKCHSTNLDYLYASKDKKKVFKYVWCWDCKTTVTHYSCQHDYWWERLYLTIRDFIRRLR